MRPLLAKSMAWAALIGCALAFPAAGQDAAVEGAALDGSASDGSASDGAASAADELATAAAETVARLGTRAALRRAIEAAAEGQPRLGLAILEQLESAASDERTNALAAYSAAILELDLEPGLLSLDSGPQAPEGEPELRLDRVRERLARALALAGPGALRARAAEALGTLELFVAEGRFRRFVEEASRAQPAGMPIPGQGGGSPDADPLEQVRALIEDFATARARLADRVRIDPSDEDPRANLQWAQRRIRELERLQEQLEQQQEQQQEQQDQEDQQQDQQQSDGEQQDSEPSPDSQESDSQESDSQEQESDSQEPDQPQEEEGSEPEQQESSAPEEDGAEEESAEQQAAEEALSEEEITALLDRLAELEERAEQLRAERARAARQAVERDW